MEEWQYHYYKGTPALEPLCHSVTVKGLGHKKYQATIRSCGSWKTMSTIELCFTPETVPTPRCCCSGNTIPPAYVSFIIMFCFAPVCTSGPKGGTAGRLRALKTKHTIVKTRRVSVRAPPVCSAACHQRREWQLSVLGSLENSPAIDLSGTDKNQLTNFTSYCALSEICRLVKMQPLLLCSVDAGGSVQGNEDMTAPVCLGMHACMLYSTQLLHACTCACTSLWNSKLTQNFFFPSSFIQNRSSGLYLCLSSAMLTPASQQSRHISVRDNLQLERTGSREGGKNQLWLLHSWLLPFGPLQQKSLTFVGCVYKAGMWCWRGQYTEEAEVLDQQLSQQLGCCFEEKQNRTWMDVRTNSGWNPPCSSLPELCIQAGCVWSREKMKG